MIRVQKNGKFFPMLSVILVFYMIAINNANITALSMIFIFISTIFILKPLYILPPLFISSLNENYFVLFQGVSVSRILVVILLIGFFMELALKSRKLKLIHIFILLFMIGFTLLSAITSISGDITPAIGMILNFAMFFVMINIKIDNCRGFIVVLTISVVLYSISNFITILVGDPIYVSNRLVLDSAVNANRMGMALAQMSAFLLAISKIGFKLKVRLICMVLFVSNVILLVLTGSRSAMIGLIMGGLLMYLIKLSNENRFSKKILSIVTISIVFLGIYFSLLLFSLPILERFSISNALETGGTGRVVIWLALIQHVIPNNLLFGVGFGGSNVMHAVSPYVIIPHGTHNMLLTIIAQMGIVGLLIYLSFFIGITKTIISHFKQNKYIVVPLTMILTAYGNGIGEEIFSERFLWFGLGLAIIFVNYSENQKDIMSINT